MSKPPPSPSAPTTSVVGPCPTVMQIVGCPGTGSLPSTIAPPDHPSSFKNKTASDVIKGLEAIIIGGRKPQLLRTDRGSEFKNRYMGAFLKKHGIHHIFSMNETKSNFAERAIQNLQNRLSRMFMYKQSYSYLEELGVVGWCEGAG